jgi:hypothetical protein
MLGIKNLVTLTLLGAGALSLGACAAPTTGDDTSEVASPIQNGGKDWKDGKDRNDDDEDCDSKPSMQSQGPGSKEDCEVRKHERKRDRDRKHDRKDDCDEHDKGPKGDCRPKPPPPPPPKEDCDDHDGQTW